MTDQEREQMRLCLELVYGREQLLRWSDTQLQKNYDDWANESYQGSEEE